ncbi:MAG: hypothetical protein J6C13_01780, partial [Clostridia bacterium]|nr:hypothetical protein [Clostridia bacterium]
MKGIAFLAGSALLIVTFFLPFWIYPFGAYQGSDVNGDYYINFHFDKTYESNMADIDSQGYYTIADNKVYISDTKDF